tara:strand:+ start:45858 stop:46394 length:537 start_codon:yes stop_codon:yes gene_type:complete
MKITLCGSARFEDYFKFWNEQLSLCGHVVYSLSVYPSDKQSGKDWYTEEQKQVLDQVHLDKIRNSDAILVLNRHAYIGESTMKEIEFARNLGKTVYALESWGKGYGIAGNHYQAIQNEAKFFDVYGKGSPIPTTSPDMKGMFVGDELFGGAGERRSAVCRAKDKFYEERFQMFKEKEQ